MTNAKKCDRCGNLYEFYDGFSIEEGGSCYNEFFLCHHWATSKRGYDLCPECMISLIKWIKEDSND